MTVQHAKWLEEALELPWRTPVPSLNILLTSTCWRNDHNGFSHQGPGLIDTVLSKKGTVARIYLPPDANCLLSVADHCLRSRELRQPDRHRQAAAAAVARHGRGRRALRARRVGLALGEQRPRAASRTSCWPRRRHPDPGDGGGGLAAAQARPEPEGARGQRRRPDVPLRPRSCIRTAWRRPTFVELFTDAKPVVFAFHGYQRAVHEIIHGRTERGALPRARLHRGGDDDDALRHGRAQRDEPLSPVHGGAAAVRLPPGRPADGMVSGNARPSTRPTRASISRTCRKSATGSGPTCNLNQATLRPALRAGKERSDGTINK